MILSLTHSLRLHDLLLWRLCDFLCVEWLHDFFVILLTTITTVTSVTTGTSVTSVTMVT